MKRFSTYVGLDVHKNSISVAFVGREEAKAHSLGRLPNDETRLLHALKPLGVSGEIQICYEAGPTGYGLVRRLRELGYDCQVVAPAKTPKMTSDRVKTDRRDAIKLADFLRSGHLTFIRVPTPEEEAMRDLLRARDDIKTKETNSKRQLNSMMLRHGRIFRSGKSLWTKLHLDWIEQQVFDLAASQEAKDTYVGEVRRYKLLLEDLDRRIEELSATLRRSDLVNALRAFKGIKTLTAATIVAEVGDLKRFPSAAQFASFLGLTPSEHSSGGHTQRGGITKTGNGHARRVLIECAWHYRHPAKVSRWIGKISPGCYWTARN